ncbi:MAG: tetratricopeptide repeat protein [Candidatus Competibacteraceae bacterium]|nr:tetratricopeptide repeat protein [Candidatus Competibacteraceae bacterium]
MNKPLSIAPHRQHERTDLPVLAALAREHLQAGDRTGAESIFREVMRRWPDLALGYDGLGQLCLSAQRYPDAVACFRNAVAREPDTAAHHNNLSLALYRQGDYPAAEQAGRAALRLNPVYPEAWNNLGNALFGRQESAFARAAYREAVHHRPGYVKAWLNLARVEILLNNNIAARRAARHALRLTSESALGWQLLAQAEQGLRHYPEALAAVDEALCRSPETVDLLILKGGLLRDAFQPEAAITLLDRATRQNPENSQTWNELGLTLDAVNRLPEAAAAFDQAIAALAADGRQTGENRIEITPETMATLHKVRYNRTMNYLKQGDFAQGWTEYFHRWNGRGRDFDREFGIPRWQGETLDDQHLLVVTEQGLGDTLQFIRYLDLLIKHARPARVTLVTTPPLAKLLADYPGIDQFILPGQQLLPAQHYTLLMDLPYWFQTRLDTIPAHVPYLPISHKLRQTWRQILDRLPPGRRIGIAWQGNPEFGQDYLRSIPLARLAPLFEVPGIQWVQLQRNAGVEQIAELDLPIQDMGDANLVETAALVAGLDLIITSDSMIAHLAGALGRPVWVLLSAKGEWRFLVDRDDSPWYPTMRLFRQTRLGDWATVAERVRATLAAWVLS